MSAIADGGWRTQGRRGAAGEPDGWLQLATQLAVLPFRIVGLGVELMARTAQEIQRFGERAAGAGGSGVSSAAGPPPAWRPGPVWPVSGETIENAGAVTVRAAGAVADVAATTNREERKMSADKDLSGTDLKIVEYSIVSVDPDDDDVDRVLEEGKTVATTDDMSEEGFTAWRIAAYMQQPGRPVIQHERKKYLRVCYTVLCRMPIPELNYQKKQATELGRINKTLEARLPLPGGGGGYEGGSSLPEKDR